MSTSLLPSTPTDAGPDLGLAPDRLLAARVQALDLLLAPSVNAALGEIRSAYAPFADEAVVSALRAEAGVLAVAVTTALGQGSRRAVTADHLVHLCDHPDARASRNRWCRLLALVAALQTIET